MSFRRSSLPRSPSSSAGLVNSQSPPHHSAPTQFPPALQQSPLTTGGTAHSITSNSIDDLTAILSQTHIDSQNRVPIFPEIESSLRTLANIVPPLSLPNFPIDRRNDEVAHVVNDVLRVELQAAHTDSIITSDHQCFAPARAFCERWDIPEQALENFIKLSCGDTKFPVLLLLTPSDGHEEQSYVDMFRNSSTLRWIYHAFKDIGVNVADISILDVCPLLSQRRIRQMGPADAQTAIEEAYGLIEKLLETFKPNIVVSCQCTTRGTRTWSRAGNSVALQLCSSVSGAKSGHVEIAQVGDHKIKVVQGFHPMYILYEKDDYEYQIRERILKEIFQRVYSPCASWKPPSDSPNLERELSKCLDTAVAELLLSAERLLRKAKSGETGHRNKPDYLGIKDEFLANSTQSKAEIDKAFKTFLGKLERQAGTNDRTVEGIKPPLEW
ncbi:hypothetical protein GP486_001576 [Trichoglossum hirsutum]|uniref:Uncharacterized protein n=1 Tax=Trichoglossum hirsutum TaxID=265104 RepID=A0A9P8RSX8_9PEZI|nr:hypothetical protein GP486_001576 [Trichoglossum hirsutum]